MLLAARAQVLGCEKLERLGQLATPWADLKGARSRPLHPRTSCPQFPKRSGEQINGGHRTLDEGRRFRLLRLALRAQHALLPLQLLTSLPRYATPSRRFSCDSEARYADEVAFFLSSALSWFGL